MPKQKANIHVASIQPIELQEGWIHIMPAGVLVGYDGRGPYELRDANTVITASQRKKVDMVIDRDHEIMFKPRGSHKPAAGWVKEMQAREDGIWARVEFTPAAQRQIEEKEYRYISPVFATAPDGVVLRILHASLVNDPNLEVTAVASADHEFTQQENDTMNEKLIAIASALGLANPANEEAILAHAKDFASRFKSFEEAVNAFRVHLQIDKDKPLTEVVAHAAQLVAGSKPNPADYVPMSVHQEVTKQLADLQGKNKQEKADEAVAAAMKAGKVSPAQKKWALEYASSDLDGFNKFIETAPVILLSGQDDATKDKTNTASAELDETDLQVCQQLGIAPEDYKKDKAAKTAA